MGETKLVDRKLAKEVRYVDAYLDEYYSSLTRENAEIGEYLARVTSGLPDLGRPNRIVDVACGPTALYWALFTSRFDERHGVDARQENVAHVEAELQHAQLRMHDRYRVVCRAAAGAGDEAEHFEQVCRSFKSIVAADLLGPFPFAAEFADVVTSIFGIEHLDTAEALLHALAEARRILKPGGRIVVVALSVTSPWLFRGDPVHVLSLTDGDLRDAFARAGFVDAAVERRNATTAIERDQGYDAMIFGSAARPR